MEQSRYRLFRLTPVVLAAIALNPAACDCEEEPISVVECDFEASRDAVSFPPTVVGGPPSVASLTVRNTSRGVSLTALEARFDLNGEHFEVEIPDDIAIPPGGDETFVLRFAPRVDAAIVSRLVLSHPNAGDVRCPSVEVTLRGTGEEELNVDAGPDDAGVDDAGPDDAGPPTDAGPEDDAGTVDPPDSGIALGPDAEWFAYGGLEDARMGFAAVELADGHVLVIGGVREDGQSLDSIERFNPQTGVSRIVARMAQPRAEPAVAVLSDGRVVVVGGRNAAVDGFALRSVEVFDPTTNRMSCADPDPSACADADAGLLPLGRIGAIATATPSDEVIVALGRTLEGGNEVPLGGGEVITLTPPTAGPLAQGSSLTPRVGVAHATNPEDGSVLLVGGRTSAGTVIADVARINTLTRSVSVLNAIATPRADAAVALFDDGTAMVAGGASGAGVGLTSVERIRDPFGAATIEDVDLLLTPRVGGSLLTLGGGIVLWAGGLAAPAPTQAEAGVTPMRDADIVVPLGLSSFLRVSTDNELAHGRVFHAALVLGADRGTALFLGGSNTAPRRTPHPHAERYLLDENRFVSWGTMGPGTAYEAGMVANDSPALVSAGGVDPHTGRTSDAVRAFDVAHGRFLERGTLREPRRDHTATRISVNDDQVLLVIGGRDETGTVLGTMSLYDPVNGTDRPLPTTLATPRALHTATRLADDNPVGAGAVLVCGGVGQGGEALDSCELIVPPADPFSPSTFDDEQEVPVIEVLGRLATGRVSHTATLLDNGEVLLLGGGDPAVDQVAADVVVLRASSSFVRQSQGLPIVARRGHAALHIGAGQVLIVGGEAFGGVGIGATASAELYVRGADAFLPLPEMTTPRAAPALVLLADGDVLVAGGARDVDDLSGVLSRSQTSSELYVRGPDGTGVFETLPDLPLSYGRADVRVVNVFGLAVIAGGTHRDGVLSGGGERRTPVTFVDVLQAPEDAIQP